MSDVGEAVKQRDCDCSFCIVARLQSLDQAVLDAADAWLEGGAHDSVYSERLAEAVRARRKGRDG